MSGSGFGEIGETHCVLKFVKKRSLTQTALRRLLVAFESILDDFVLPELLTWRFLDCG